MQRVPRIERSATASWGGSVARGRGRLSAPSRALVEIPFSLAGRTAPSPTGETSPEELLAAAHAGCFAMALSAQLTRRNAPPDLLTVTATSSLDEVAGRNRIVAGELVVEVAAPGLPPGELENALREADERCPFSALLRDAGATVTVTLSPDAVT
jgi:osmotically inducible protein OsmC